MRNNSCRLSRRETLGLLAAALAPAVGQEQPAPVPAAGLLQVARVDHFSIRVSNVQKTIAFYRRLFGSQVLRATRGDRHYLILGTSYIEIAPDPARVEPQARLDSVSPGIERFDAGSLQSKLKRANFAAKVVDGSLALRDPDGIALRLSAEQAWKQIQTVPEPAAPPDSGLFHPQGIDHLVLSMPDPEKSAAFYGKLFGAETSRGKDPLRIWYRLGTTRLALSQQPGREKTGMDHFAILADRFDPGETRRRILELGITTDPAHTDEVPQFRDPDGILVQVEVPRRP